MTVTTSSAPEGQARQLQPCCRRQFPPYYMWRPYGCQSQCPNVLTLLGKEKQRRMLTTGAQKSQVDQWYRICVRAADHSSVGTLFTKNSLEMTAGKMRKIKETRPNVSRHPSICTATSITSAVTQATLNHKMAERQKQPTHQLRICPLPRRAKKGQLNVSFKKKNF